MKDNIMDEVIESMSEDELEEVMESIVVQLEMLLEHARAGQHTVENKLTATPAGINDTLH